MNKCMRFAFVLLMFMACLGRVMAAPGKDYSLSEARIEAVRTQVEDCLSENPELTVKELIQLTEKALRQKAKALQDSRSKESADGEQKQLPTTEEKALEAFLEATEESPALLLEDKRQEKLADKELIRRALKAYPNYSDSELRQRAAEIYPLYKLNQRVKVKYHKRAGIVDTAEGVFKGMRGGNIVLGSQLIRLADLQGIEGNDGSHGEIAKFDKMLNQRLRDEWMEKYREESAVSRKDYESSHREEVREEQKSKEFLENQENGYTFWDDEWFTPEALVVRIATDTVETARRTEDAQKTERIRRGDEEIAAQMNMASQSYAIAPIGTLPSVSPEDRGAQQAQGDAGETEDEDDLDSTPSVGGSQRAADASPVVEQKSSSLWLYLVIGVIVVGGAGFGVWMFFFHQEKELDVSKFYESKGDFQEGFWASAEADPERFKYVAYLFDNVDEAKNALCQLSFVGMGVNGELKAKRDDIILGAYSHQNRAVAVIGGLNLNYARWREASMVWPELPNAAYFRQSSEPKVKLVMPSAEELSRQDGLEVEKLGEEDVRAESGEINRVFRYRCANRENALRFLALFKVEEEGVVVRVETAEGEFGKDINGVFTV